VILYLDTSALAKLFIAEPGSQQDAAAVGSSLAAATHRLAYLEKDATLAKAVRIGRIESSTLEPRLREFEDRWASLEVVEATEPCYGGRRVWPSAMACGATTAFTWRPP